jgi:hypothetical protein
MHTGTLAIASAAVVLSGSVAWALPFDPSAVSGTVTLDVGNAGFAPRMIQTTPVHFPEVQSYSLVSPYIGAFAEIDYTLEAVGEKAVFDFYAKEHTGTGGSDHEGFVLVDLSFTTMIDSIYSFTAIYPFSDEYGVGGFRSEFNGLVASKYPDRNEPGGIGGTFPYPDCPPCNPPSDTFFRTGYLPAGTYSLTIGQGSYYRGYSGTSDSKVTLELDPVPEFSTMVLAMLGLGSLTMWRRHRA